MERIFEAAKRSGYEVFISPHYFYPTDDGWKMNGPLEADEFRTHTFARKGPLTLTGFANSGADWLDRFKLYIEDGKTIVVSPHKVFGPQTNDLVLQLRKRGGRDPCRPMTISHPMRSATSRKSRSWLSRVETRR